MAVDTDVNDLAYWYPRLHAAGIPSPNTHIVQWPGEPGALASLLDGIMPGQPDGMDDPWVEFLIALAEAGASVANQDSAWFLRTGHTSGKHSWGSACHVQGVTTTVVAQHVAELIDISYSADMFGLPHETWAARSLLPVVPLCVCTGYGGMPVVREFRFICDSGYVDHVQPYWPAKAVALGSPSAPGWEAALAAASTLDSNEYMPLHQLAMRAAAAATGPDRLCETWSVDVMQVYSGAWVVIDMADAARSYRYDPPHPVVVA